MCGTTSKPFPLEVAMMSSLKTQLGPNTCLKQANPVNDCLFTKVTSPLLLHVGWEIGEFPVEIDPRDVRLGKALSPMGRKLQI